MGEPYGANLSKCRLGAYHAVCKDTTRRHVFVDDGRCHGRGDEVDIVPRCYSVRASLQRLGLVQVSE